MRTVVFVGLFAVVLGCPETELGPVGPPDSFDVIDTGEPEGEVTTPDPDFGPPDNPCAGLQTCPTAGEACQGDTLVLCQPGPGAACPLVTTEVDCKLEFDGICGADDLGPACVEAPPTCTDAPECAAAGVVCHEGGLLECGPGDNDGGCLVIVEQTACVSPTVCVDEPTPHCEASGETVGDWTVFVVATLETPNPDESAGAFTGLGRDPVIAQGTVVLRATTLAPTTPPQSTEATGIYRAAGDGPLEALVVAGDAVPAGTGSFESFEPLIVNAPRLHGGAVAFVGNAANEQRGVYRLDYSEAQNTVQLKKIVDRNDDVPSTTGKFVYFGEPLIFGQLVAFGASGQGGGAYVAGPDGALTKVLGNDDEIPGGKGPFLSSGMSDMSNGTAALVGHGDPPDGVVFEGTNVQRGIYLRGLDGGLITAVSDRTTPIPGQDDTFHVSVGPLLAAGSVVFHGRGTPVNEPLGPFGSTQYKGIFRAVLPAEAGGEITITKLADTHDVMPGGEETFSTDFANGFSSAYVSADGEDVLLRGVGTTGDQKTRIGLYIHRGATGVLERIVDTTDTLSGVAITDLLISRQALSAGEIVFYAALANGSSGVFRARLSQPGD